MGVLSIKGPSPLRRLRRKRQQGFDAQGSKEGGWDDNLSAREAYVVNLAKLIPGEIIALYSLLKLLAVPPGWEETQVIPFFAALVLVVLRARSTRENGRVRWGLVLLSFATFVCWVYVEDGWFWTWHLNAVGLYFANIALFTLAFVAPGFVGER